MRGRGGIRALVMALFTALAVLTSVDAALGAPRGHANEARIIAERRVDDRVVELTIATSAFVEPTKVDVDLPIGYGDKPHRRWPVTYVAAGTMNNYDSFNNVLHGVELVGDYPSILVSPDGNSGYWSDWYNGGAFGPPAYESYVIGQLIPLIDARFRTIPNRAHRAIFGVSMGGYGAAMLAAHHPDLFVAMASLSGAVDSNLPTIGAAVSASSTFDGGAVDAIYGPRATQEVRWRGHNPTDLAENLRGVDLQVRTANGVLDPTIGEGTGSGDAASCVIEGGVHMASVSLHEQFDALGIAHEWKDYGPGCHTPQNFKREVLDSIAVFERVFANPPAPPKRFTYRSIQPRFRVWGWTVKADPDRALEFLEISNAGKRKATFTGSGTTTVTAPDPNGPGRVRFTVDLGPPHPDQEFTDASRAAGEGTPGYFTTKTVKFAPRR